MSTLSEIVQLTITQDTVGIARAGFGTPLLLSYNATFPERVRYYQDLPSLAADGFATSSPEYLTAQAVFSQSPHALQLAIGRGANKPTQQYTIGAVAIRNSDSSSYKINVVGQGFTSAAASYTSDSTATAQEIHNGLVTALNAVVGKNYTATFAPLTYSPQTFTVFDQPTGKLTITAHGLQTGDGPFQLTTTGTLPTGLATVTNYFAIRFDANTIQLATSLANALAGTPIVLSSNGTGTNTVNGNTPLSPFQPFLVTGAVGNWFSLECTDITALSNKQTHADPGIAADLDAIQNEQPDWYCLLTNFNALGPVTAAANWTEAQTKIYVFDVPNTDAVNVVVGSGTDVLATLHTAALTRSAGAYHASPAAMLSAAWAGRVLPIDPGSESWKFKRLAGVTPSNLTATQRTNLRARNANWLQTVGGVNITQEGTVFSGNFLDITRGLDWLNDDMTKGVYGALVAVDKVPFTDQGVTIVTNEIKASLQRATDLGILASNPKFVVIAPKVADVSTSNRALRLLPNIKFSATLAGAVHRVIVAGVVSV